ncbi:hypothetical protein N9W89_07850 [Hellea sp.]|nr:hypothetical protein [Hellea sp.]
MRSLLLASIAAAALLSACGPKHNEVDITPAQVQADDDGYNLSRQYEKFAEVKMNPDTSFLTEGERAAVNKIIEASELLSEVYLRQLDVRNPEIRAEIAASDRPDKQLLLDMFDLHFGVCDSLEDGHVFYGDTPCPKGAGFYPADMTKQEFEDWITAHPEDEEAFRSGYTVIRRDGDKLIAVPYSKAYAQWLRPAGKLLREASDLLPTNGQSNRLKRFLRLRSIAFRTDDYFDSEMAWMDLLGNIEVAIGPYEVYDDQLFGYKTAFESFVTVKNPEESKALAKYKDFLKDMEANLPVEDKYKNFDRGFESPIAVTYQVHGGGDNENGVQTIAFNLPNDERVREAKGAKKVILNNVLGAKYDRILAPIGERVLVADQAKLTAKKWMSNNTLFHELSHSLGPGTITVDGVETTVNAQLKELYSGVEEGKADVMGAYNILYMMERGELPIAEKEAYLATYFTGKFRSMRFGTGAAHAKGAAYQYNYFRDAGAVEWLPEQERFKIDFPKLEQAISDLTGEIVRLQGDGNYGAVKVFLDEYLPLDAEAKIVIGHLDDIPYDIRPIYPDKI